MFLRAAEPPRRQPAGSHLLALAGQRREAPGSPAGRTTWASGSGLGAVTGKPRPWGSLSQLHSTCSHQNRVRSHGLGEVDPRLAAPWGSEGGVLLVRRALPTLHANMIWAVAPSPAALPLTPWDPRGDGGRRAGALWPGRALCAPFPGCPHSRHAGWGWTQRSQGWAGPPRMGLGGWGAADSC